MFAYIVRRLIITVPVLIGVTMISFAIVNLAPGESKVLEPVEKIETEGV